MSTRRVYPRVCGGTSKANGLRDSLRGLSPRVRGNPVRHRHAVGVERSIPACAGEPDWCSMLLKVARVYPRVCGGTQDRGAPIDLHSGLSPRVRGNRTALSVSPCTAGSIPACAGEPTTGQ